MKKRSHTPTNSLNQCASETASVAAALIASLRHAYSRFPDGLVFRFAARRQAPSRYGGGAGFSLLETLVALAIAATVSAALIQGVSYWVALSERSSASVNRSLTSLTLGLRIEALANRIVRGWPEQEDTVFFGTASEMSGLTAAPLHLAQRRLVPFRLFFEPDEAPLENREANLRLVYSSEHASVVLARSDREGAAIAYLGRDGVWHDHWPLAAAEHPVWPGEDMDWPAWPLPLAIRVCLDNGIEPRCYIGRLDQADMVVFREDGALSERGEDEF